ncbi:MAG: hypothetical protein US89_C0002G0010 [Candidatus Peregrinibacteria bacterium GW2011_GWF2_38_29]|nr:MAG: hypothetical protein US89_C0002G0010 [Candidatus Peregrinibacteria bacterium GW2011_GWF2_38_29]HBB02166.1 hypothetical protein [Candidatus Peregrinibacteria bacterium]
MTPLAIFGEIAKLLAKKPFTFLDEKARNLILKDAKIALSEIVSKLETKVLNETLTYKTAKKTLDFLHKFDEVEFVQALDSLVDIYLYSENVKIKKAAHSAKSFLTKAKKHVLEYHISLEKINQRAEEMSEKDQEMADLKHLQNVGVFYVLEYTLQVLFEFSRISDENKKKLLNDGLKTDAGNLPSYLPLEDSFRQELCLKIFDEKLRNNLLFAFYEFEENLEGEIDLKKIAQALKKFNLFVLNEFDKKGFKTFKALVYKPFGNNVSLSEIIEKINLLKI